MNETIIGVISDIIASFDIQESYHVLSSQIINPEEDYTSPVLDQFQPLYMNYKEIDEMKDVDLDDINEAKNKFYNICLMIISLIESKFGMSFDEEYLADNKDQLPAIALSLYSFFVVDFYSIVYEIVKNYLVENVVELHSIFEDYGNKKDSVSLTNKKIFSNEMSTVASNIYDISEYILSSLDTETVFKYIDDSYIPSVIIKGLYDKNCIIGDFVRKIADIYKNNTSLKAKVGFDILIKIKNNEIQDVFALLNDREDA